MSQPTPFVRTYSFTAFSASSPSAQQSGTRLDAENNAIELTLGEILLNLALIQRDDGQLANDSVGLDQLTTAAETDLIAAVVAALGDIGGGGGGGGGGSVTFTGDVTGSGTTIVALTLAASGASPGTYKSVTVDAKGRVTAGSNPTTLVGFGITDAAPAASPVLTGAIYSNGSQKGNVTALAALDVDCDLGNYFTKTIAGDSTFTFSNAPTGSYGFTLKIVHTSGAITWPASVQPPKNGWPTLTTGKIHLFMFQTDNSGTIWRGAVLPDYAA